MRKVVAEFGRKEVMESTETTSNRLQYLERSKLVVPHKRGRNVFYSWTQLLQIRAIKHLRKEVSLQQVRKIIKFLNESGFDSELYNKQLVVVDGDVFWVSADWEDFSQQMPKSLKVASKRRKDIGQYMLTVIPPLINVAEEIINTAKRSKIIDIQEFIAKVGRACA